MPILDATARNASIVSAFAVLMTFGLATAPAQAQTQPTPSARDASGAQIEKADAPQAVSGTDKPDTPAASPTVLLGVAPTSAEPDYAYFDSLLEPGAVTGFPGSADTATQDLNGYRTWLADHDMGLRVVLGATVTANPFPTGQPTTPQRYNGQQLTLNTSSQNFTLGGKLTSVGLPHTWWFVGLNNTFTSFYNNGPSSRYIQRLGIYQELFGGKISIKAGILPNYYEYAGFFVGGSPILASGIPGLLPISAGLGADPANVPVLNITAYGKSGTYLRAGVQRSTSVRGLPDEVISRPTIVPNFTLRDAGPLFIAETGIRRAASLGSHQLWLRAGGLWNSSDYRRFDGIGVANNASLYALGDWQATQPDSSAPSKGLYVGGSAFWVPKSVNTSTQSYEMRTYAIGPFKGRDKDTLTFRAIYTTFSDDARRAQRANNVLTNPDQLTVSLSYAARATHGLFITPGLSYIRHPSFVGDFNDAMVMSMAIFVIG